MRPNRRQVISGIGTGVLASTVPIGSALARGGDSAGLRVAHASPDAPAVDVSVDGGVAVPGLKFRSVTDYLEIPAGEHTVAVNVAGTDTTVFGPVTLDLAADDHTAIARGEVTSSDTTFTVSVRQDTNGANLDDEARIRAIHASPDAPAVDVTVDDGALTVFDDLAYFGSSDYAVVPAGTYEIEIRPGGGGSPVFEVPGVTLAAGSTYTAFAEGYLTPDDEPTSEGFGLVLTEDASAPPRGEGEMDGMDGDDGTDGGEMDKEEDEEAEAPERDMEIDPRERDGEERDD